MKNLCLSALLLLAMGTATRAQTSVSVQIPAGAVPIDASVQSTGPNTVEITVDITTSKGNQQVKVTSIIDLPDPISIQVGSGGKTMAVFVRSV